MKKEKKKNIILFAALFFITILIYWNYITMHYATDTYNIINVGYTRYAIEWSLKDGRIFMSLIGLIANKLQIPITIYVIGLLVIAIFISCIATIKLKDIILKYKKTDHLYYEIIATIIAYVTIFNFMYVENMYFVECAVMAMSIFCFLLAADFLVEQKSYWHIKSILLVVLGVICYQGTIGFFMALVFLFSIIKYKNQFKKVFLDLIKCGVISLIAVGINVLLVSYIGKIIGIEQTRISSISSIWNNIEYIFSHISIILTETCGLFPKYFLLGFVFLVFLITIFYYVGNFVRNFWSNKVKLHQSVRLRSNLHMWRSHFSYEWKNSNKNLNIPKMIFITIFTIATSFVIFLMTLSSYYTGRLRFCIGALIGILMIYLYTQTEIFERKGIAQICIQGTLFLYLVCNIYECVDLTYQHKMVNQLEKQEVYKINEDMIQYEMKNDIKIEYICIVTITGQNQKAYYKEIENQSVLTYNAIRSDWSTDGVINFYTGRNLKKTKITQEELIAYMEKIKSGENQKEYECIGNTLVINAYMY